MSPLAGSHDTQIPGEALFLDMCMCMMVFPEEIGRVSEKDGLPQCGRAYPFHQGTAWNQMVEFAPGLATYCWVVPIPAFTVPGCQSSDSLESTSPALPLSGLELP